ARARSPPASGCSLAARAGRERAWPSSLHLLDLTCYAGPGTAGRVEKHVVERHVVRESEPRLQLRLQLVGRSFAHDPPAVDDREAIAELIGFLEVLRRQEDRGAAVVD